MTSPSDLPPSNQLAEQANSKITRALREHRNGHLGLVVWLTGLSGAGKTTIATELERQLFHEGRHTYLLDGDILRHGLCSDLGYSAEARTENIRRAGEVAALMCDAGCIVIAAFISPFRVDRERVRRILADRRFIEVFVNAPLEVCERRDVKGLYAKARAGKISEFTGISAPYEAPESPEVEVRTDQISLEAAVDRIMALLRTQTPRSTLAD